MLVMWAGLKMKKQHHTKRIAPEIDDLFISIIQNVMKELTGANMESQLDVVKCVKKHWKKKTKTFKSTYSLAW